ncbi:hypothetical protein J1605_018497 [Eschrichtius robustus]|uniref:Uncharacterized protein n=1 Tax=Eschrichtius robustus TaxID=9764 RepID=A0AB34HTZ4_ESCRO|nr:hypothetical protein J1605_018497 [Eschrichtius robustus]
MNSCSSSSAWWLDCCSEQWGLCAYLKGLEEGPPEAEAHPQRAGPTPSSTVPAQETCLLSFSPLSYLCSLLLVLSPFPVSPRVKPTDTPFLDFILLYFVPFSLLLNQFCSNRDKGMRNIGKTDLRPTCIFLRLPSLDRLEQRNTDTEQSLAAARADLKPGEQHGARPV